jgi:hypothetical protein
MGRDHEGVAPRVIEAVYIKSHKSILEPQVPQQHFHFQTWHKINAA